MADQPTSLVTVPDGYREWLESLKKQIHTARQRAARSVNTEMLRVYWQIGRDILDRQHDQGWGTRIVDRVSHDLRHAFPGLGGFSRANLMYMRSFADAWELDAIVQQPVGQLPWSHNIVLLTKLKDRELRLAYADAAVQFAWSRNVLTMHIERGRIERQGRATTNFADALPAADTDLAQESLKDPYRLDFLGLGDEAREREIESALVDHLADFLLELGAGFAYVGRQVHLDVGGDDFFIDLLFYHLKLRRYVVVELKTDRFKPEHLGQLGFYMTAIDETMKHSTDEPTIGLLLCKSKNQTVVEYALRDTAQPLGVAEYQLVDALPDALQTQLPTISQIETELSQN